MRIVTLTLKNFRSHQETALDLNRFKFVREPNGSGKRIAMSSAQVSGSRDSKRRRKRRMRRSVSTKSVPRG